MKFAFYTLGCKVNLFETQALEQIACARGHEIVQEGADAVVLNTCTVTSVSDHKNIRAIHRLRRQNPRAILAACGCFAQMSPERLQQTGQVDLVMGTQNRADVIAQCEKAVLGEVSLQKEEGSDFDRLPAGVPHGRTRALLKIEDGCNNFCTYCIIPYARGRVRSMPLQQALDQTRRLETQGVHEIVVTGIEIARYGQDLTPVSSLVELMEQLLTGWPTIRFRLGSLDPRVVDQQFCQRLARFDNLARHFHLSLQSGSDAVLSRMGRGYTTKQYEQAVMLLKNTFEDCSITTDIIVGFPGESEQEFLETLDFMQKCAFADVHVFPYSQRSGTRAAIMPDQIEAACKKERADRAKEVACVLSKAYRARFEGQIMGVLPEHQKNGDWVAHGPYAFPVYIKKQPGIQKNHPIEVRVEKPYQDGVYAQKLLE